MSDTLPQFQRRRQTLQGLLADQGRKETLTNYGLVSLAGGTFDNGGFALTNQGSIFGTGTLRTNGLINKISVSLSDGNNSVYGWVTNNAGSKLYTYGSGTNVTTFYGMVTSLTGSETRINGGIVRFLRGSSLGGNYHSDPADNYFTGLTVISTGTLTGASGDRQPGIHQSQREHFPGRDCRRGQNGDGQ